MPSRPALLLAALLASAAYADRGALSLDLGGGVVTMSLPAPYADAVRSPGSAFTTTLGARYALTNGFEASASVFLDPPVLAGHPHVTLNTPDGAFPGTLNHRVLRYGALAGGRFVHGSVWRLTAGLEAGLSRRSYSAFQHVNDADPANQFDYGLRLPDATATNLVLSPLAGLEWAGGDHWSLSVLPRVAFLIGDEATTAVSLPIVFSWSWYL